MRVSKTPFTAAVNEVQIYKHVVVMERGLIEVKWFEVKNILIMDIFLTNMEIFSSQGINWSGVDYL